MNWQVSIGSKKFVISIPDNIHDGRSFTAAIDNKALQLRWNGRQQNLEILSSPTGEPSHTHQNIKLRTFEVQQFAGESQTRINLEFAAAGMHQMHSLATSVEPYVPGQEYRSESKKAAGCIVRSPMTGKVLAVNITEGAEVASGTCLLTIEAMKMENKVFTNASGTVAKLKIRVGDAVTTGQELLTIT